MIKKDIKDLMKTIKFTGITINLGFIGLNFAGGFSKENISLIYQVWFYIQGICYIFYCIFHV